MDDITIEYVTKSGRRYRILKYVPYGVVRYQSVLQKDPNNFEAYIGIIREMIVEYPAGLNDPTKLPLTDINEIVNEIVGPLFRKFEEGMRNIAKH